MTAQTILPANTLSSGYDVDNSVRFNDGDSPSLKDSASNAAPGGTRTKFTFSIWFKRGVLGTTQTLGAAAYSSSDEGYFQINSDDKFEWDSTENNNGNLITNRLFRDASAWYHIVIAVDTTQGTAANRMKVYVNGVQETSFATETYPDQNTSLYWNVGGTYYPYIGRKHGGEYFDGYIAEVVNIDNQQLAADSFGEFDDSGIWKPIDVSDLTFGTAGYYLDFEDSSELGKDVSGVGNSFVSANLAATDQTTDTCTNNFATWNDLINSNGSTSEANLKYTTSNGSSDYGYRNTTIGVNKGKWYVEIKYTSSSVQAMVGIRSRLATAVVHYLGYYADDYGFYIDGSIYQNNGDRGDLGASWGNDDIVGIYLDLDNNKLYFSKNGTLYTATGHDITAAASTTTGNYFFSATEWNSSGNGAFELNAGNPVSALDNAAITDDNGYGAFEYSPNITGDSVAKKFYALNTKNLAEFG